MKKYICFSLSILIVLTGSHAQSGRIGFTAGTTISNYQVKMEGASESQKSKTGITAGIVADLPLSNHFSIRPAVHFLQKGTMNKQSDYGMSYKMTLNVNMVEFPVEFMYNVISPAGNFFIGAGPALGIGISGKLKVKADSQASTESVGFGNGQSDLLRIADFGISASTGFCFPNGLLLAAGFNQGLSNVEPQPEAGESLKSHYFSIRLGWMFKNSKQVR